MQKKRLLKLADLLKENAKNPKGMKFDLGSWGLVESSFHEPDVSCNTVGCAMGLAAISGAFEKEGLFYTKDFYSRSIKVMLRPKGGGIFCGFEAAAKLFNIPVIDADWLFSSDGYATSKNLYPVVKGAEGERKVARRIRAYVAGTARPPKNYT